MLPRTLYKQFVKLREKMKSYFITMYNTRFFFFFLQFCSPVFTVTQVYYRWNTQKPSWSEKVRTQQNVEY